MTIYTTIPYNSNDLLKTSIERQSITNSIDILTFMSCDKNLETIESSIFDYQHIDIENKTKCFINNKTKEIKNGFFNFMPIVLAFKKIKKINNTAY